MKNLKRALSLGLAMVMLLGMMVVPAGAVGVFADAEEIENVEAVAITSGMGLFAGADGKFNPKGTVTRAQMATVIVKMLRGAEFNADAFKGVGVNPFADTADFEGGWAEGYINACYQMGVVAGYGDGTFKPGKTLTTAEALTMIINALGVDPGPGDWPVTYMAKAEAMKLYGELSPRPGTNNILTRDQLAVIVLEGLQYSPAGKSGYRVPGSDLIFTDVADAVLANGNSFEGITEVVGTDSLAGKVYEFKMSTGFITDNQAAGEDATVLTLADGTKEYYGVETGLDMLGHYVTVYYREQYESDSEPGQVYAVVDESKVVTVTETIDTAKKYKAAFEKSYDVARNGIVFDGTYVPTEKFSNNMASAISGYTKGSNAAKGTYIIADGVIVAYIGEVVSYASYISDIADTDGSEAVLINGANNEDYIPNSEGNDLVIEYTGMKVGDFITYTEVQGVYTLAKVEAVNGVVTKSAATEIDGVTYDTLTVGGEVFVAFDPACNKVGRKLDTTISSIEYGQSYTLYVTDDNRYLGFESAGASVSVNDVAYLLGVIKTSETDTYGKKVISYKARGVDPNGVEVLLLVGKVVDTNGNKAYDDGEDAWGDVSGALTAGFYTVEASTDKEDKQEGIQVLTPFNDAFSVDKPTYVTYNNASSSWSMSGYTTTMDGMSTYGKTGSKIVILSGSLTQSAPLETKTYTTKLPSAIAMGAQGTVPMIVTRASNGAMNEVEVVIFLQEDVDAAAGGDYIYVSQEQLNGAANTADGLVYEAYAAEDGAVGEYILASGVRFSRPGFYDIDEDDGLVTKVTAITADLEESGKAMPAIYLNQGFLGTNSTRLFGSNLKESLPVTSGVSSLKVVDTRTETEIEVSGAAKVTNLTQLTQMVENDPGTMVVFDLFANTPAEGESGRRVKTLYITAIYRKTTGNNSVLYALDAPAESGGTLNMVVAKSGNKALGDVVKVTYDTCDSNTSGFYRFGVGASGERALVKMDADYAQSGYYYTLGLHNKVTAINETAMTVTTRDYTDDMHSGSCSGGYEALKSFSVTDDTVILNTDGSALTLAQLKDLLDNPPTVEGLIIDHYHTGNAASGVSNDKKDKTAELIVVYKPVFPYHAENGTALGTKTELTGGVYYLNGNTTAAGGITVTGNVTLCLNGSTLTAPADCGASFITVESGTLTICDGQNCRSARTGGSICGAVGTTNTRGVEVKSGATFAMGSGIISGFTTAGNGGGVLVNAGGTFSMSGGSIKNNESTATASNTGGGGVCNNGGTFTLSGGSIVLNRAGYYGGGVYVLGTSHTTNITGGNISGNYAANYGGGLTVREKVANVTGGTIGGAPISFNGAEPVLTETSGNYSATRGGGAHFAQTRQHLSNVTISGNYAAAYGGGIHTNASYFYLDAGTMLSDNAAGERGGGIYTNRTVYIADGVQIKDNEAGTFGGGVCVYGSGTSSAGISMTGGTISGNTAGTNGGGVYFRAGSNINEQTVSGGTISNNEAGGSGGGAYLYTPCTVTDGVTITGNKAAGADNNLVERS